MKKITIASMFIVLPLAAFASEGSSPEEFKSFCLCSVKIDASQQLEDDPVANLVSSFFDLDYEKRYTLFSDTYKGNLKRVFDIGGESDYSIYQRRENFERIVSEVGIVDLRTSSNGTAQVTSLVCWDQEGYTGVSTYIFDLVKDQDGEWKIANVFL